MRNYLILLAVITAGCLFACQHPKAQWHGQLSPLEPVQTAENLPPPWTYKNFTLTAKAKYRIKAVVLSKRSYWAGDIQDTLSPYDLALGWGAMSSADTLNQLDISQSGRWYEYRWQNTPPLDPAEIATHSSNNHIIPADHNVLAAIKRIKRHDLIALEGYLVDIQSQKENWSWHTSLTRTDTAGGSCEVFWVTSVKSPSP